MAHSQAGTSARASAVASDNTIEVRIAGGILALNRFMMTLQSKRMPVSRLSIKGDKEETRARFVLDCPEDAARRYATVLENLEDVEELLASGPSPAPTEKWRSGTKIDYDGRRFRSVENSASGEVGPETVFSYSQEGDVVRAAYEGGGVRSGALIATADDGGRLDARYQQVNAAGDLMTGECRTTPEVLPDGRLRLYEEWRWTSGDHSSGTSVVEEIGE